MCQRTRRVASAVAALTDVETSVRVRDPRRVRDVFGRSGRAAAQTVYESRVRAGTVEVRRTQTASTDGHREVDLHAAT